MGIECLVTKGLSAECGVIAERELKGLKVVGFVDTVAWFWRVMADVLIEDVIG